jgi:leader peptidase (prepilin peptidase) / N-methyltransferase
VTGLLWVWIVAALIVGASAGGGVRAAAFHYAVKFDEPWRTSCPSCDGVLVRPGWRLFGSALAPSGRCRHCAEAIGAPVAVVEVIAAVTLAVLAWRTGVSVGTIGVLWAALLGVCLALVDAAVHRLPDPLIVAALAGTLILFAATGDFARLGTAVLCGLAGGAFYFIMALPKHGMGLGDAKLAVLVGLVSGWFGVWAAIFAIFAGVLFAGLAAIALLALRRVGLKDKLSHGPFMLLGTLAAIILVTV